MIKEPYLNKKKRSKVKKYLSLLLALILVTGAVWGYKELQTYIHRPQVSLVHAERASFKRTLNLNAQVEARDSQLISSDYGLVVKDILVREGDFVKAGQVLYRYSRSDAQEQLHKTEEGLLRLEEKEKERQENIDKLFSDMANRLSQQLGVSLQSATSMLSSSLANFNLKDQLQDVLPEGLDELGLNKDDVLNVVRSLSQTLDSSSAAMMEIAALVQRINASGVTELTAGNLYQLLTYSQELYDQVQSVLNAALSILSNGQGIPPEVQDWLKSIIAQAEDLLKKLAELINSIQEKLNTLSQAETGIEPDVLLPENQIPNEDALNSEKPENPEEPGNSENHESPEIPDAPLPPENPVDPDSAEGSKVLPLPGEDDSSGLSYAADHYNEKSCNSPISTDKTTLTIREQLRALLQKPLELLPSHTVAAQENNADMTPGSSADTMSSIDPTLLLTLLQMDQNQGQSGREKLEADKAGLEKMLSGDGLTVKASMDGLVASLHVTEGKALPQGELEALILDGDHLVASCRVGKQDASRLQEGQKVIYHYDDLDLYGEITYKASIATQESSALGRLGTLGSQLGLDDAAGMLGKKIGGTNPKVDIRMSIQGPDTRRLTIGFDINGEVEIGEANNVLSIPVEALLQKRDRYFVDVVDQNQILQTKEIHLGLVGEKRVEVISGLEEHEAIVINPLPSLEAGQKVKIVQKNEP